MSFDPATSAPDADAFAAPDSSSAELLAALFAASPTKALTPTLLESSSDAALYHLLPLLLSTLQFVGECTVEREAFVELISALRDRVSTTDPVLKLRFMLHTAHPSFNAYWRVSDLVDPAGDDDDEGDREITVEDFEEDDPDAQILGTEDDGGGEEEEAEEEEEVQEKEEVEEVDRSVDPSRRVVKQVTLSVKCSSDLDVPSREFWQTGVYAPDEAGEVDVDHEYDLPSATVINPFFRAVDAPEGTPCAGSHVIVRKVFSSIARPKIVTISGTEDDDKVNVPPGILVKKGDNLMQDLGVMHVLQALNAIWAGDDEITAEFTKPPVAVWYDVLPTDIDAGLMQAVAGLQSLREFDWNQWADETEGDDERVLDTVRTAAGSYIATYIIGGRDRHFDNILVKDGYQVMHIDFTYILGSKPPLDAPPISLASEMQEAFERLGCWDTFLSMCAAAFACARANASAVLRVTRHAFARTGLQHRQITRFMRGKKSLNLAAGDEEAVEYVRRQCENGASDCQTWIKRIAHEVIDPAWYGLLKKGFPPAVAIVKWMDEAENKEANKLAQELKEAGDQVEDEERVELG